MKKISTLVMGVLALPMTLSAADYTPAAPDPVEYQTCFVQTRTLRDSNGDRVTTVGDQGEVKVIGSRLSTGDIYRPCGKINFTLNNTYDGNKKIANDKMAFRILVLRNGETEEQATPYIFDAEEGYIKWEQNDYQPMEWIKNGFTDAYDFGFSQGQDDGPNKYSIYFYGVSDDIAKIGVQSRWERSGKTYDSAITWAEPTTPDLTDAITWDEWEALVKEYNPEDPDVNVSVNDIEASAGTVTVHDALGRIILKDADVKQLDTLKGLYIVNGKKQILR